MGLTLNGMNIVSEEESGARAGYFLNPEIFRDQNSGSISFDRSVCDAEYDEGENTIHVSVHDGFQFWHLLKLNHISSGS